MGKGDKRTFRGKVKAASYGIARKKKKAAKKYVAPTTAAKKK